MLWLFWVVQYVEIWLASFVSQSGSCGPFEPYLCAFVRTVCTTVCYLVAEVVWGKQLVGAGAVCSETCLFPDVLPALREGVIGIFRHMDIYDVMNLSSRFDC